MITFKNVIPHPLKEGNLPTSDIWRTTVDFNTGEKVLVTAPSGQGKSTFLHIIYGIRKDFDGTVEMNGQDIRAHALDDWAKIRQSTLAMVFQDLRLFPQLTGWENIQLKNELTSQKTKENIQEMAQRLGITAILDQKAGTMSYGQRQRVAIIRTLCQPFDMLLLDEPFSHLDEENIVAACELITEAIEVQSAGMLLVSLGEPYRFNYDRTIQL